MTWLKAAKLSSHFLGILTLSTAAVDKVKIPKQWDDSFAAFNQVVEESGLTLEGHKGKTVEKWTALCPALSDGEDDTYCVLLVYKTKPVGAYLLAKPSGEVTGLVSAAQQNAADAETAASADVTADALPEDTAQTSAEVVDESAFPTE